MPPAAALLPVRLETIPAANEYDSGRVESWPQTPGDFPHSSGAGGDDLRGGAGLLRSRGLRDSRGRHEGHCATAAALEADRVAESETAIRWRDGELRGRIYLPADVSGRPILLVPGVHAAGIDEPRLINFAREIAATGHPVMTAELPDLARYQITPRTTDMIEDAAELGRGTVARSAAG